jgi:hypothetical protein
MNTLATPLGGSGQEQTRGIGDEKEIDRLHFTCSNIRFRGRYHRRCGLVCRYILQGHLLKVIIAFELLPWWQLASSLFLQLMRLCFNSFQYFIYSHFIALPASLLRCHVDQRRGCSFL